MQFAIVFLNLVISTHKTMHPLIKLSTFDDGSIGFVMVRYGWLGKGWGIIGNYSGLRSLTNKIINIL